MVGLPAGGNPKTKALREEQISKIIAFLRKHPQAYVGDEAACQRFIAGVLWVAHSGAPMVSVTKSIRPLEQCLQTLLSLV